MENQYDALVIGAGMSGMACAIRLGMFGKKVCLLEKHSIAGGLNSYYKRGGYLFDVGLHALTNFNSKGQKGPLTKLLRQLRIPYDQFQLKEQSQSLIAYPDTKLAFSNNIELLKSEIAQIFPREVDGFNRLLVFLNQFDETSLTSTYISAREELKKFFSDDLLLDMLLCPLLIYGSAWEDDMDFSQFAIMFKAIYLQGLARPEGGVRTIISLMAEKLKESRVDVCYREEVVQFLKKDQKIVGVLTNKGRELFAEQVFSSMGLPETQAFIDSASQPIGRLSFCETILLTDSHPRELGSDHTIIFANHRPRFSYKRPSVAYDPLSAVVCLPNNYQDTQLECGQIRITFIANHDQWKNLPREDYLSMKQQVLDSAISMAKFYLPKLQNNFLKTDIFTPTTITRYTGHKSGAVYGSPTKIKNGETNLKDLYLIGTDQGFLGIVGSMLSGISMANMHGLKGNG